MEAPAVLFGPFVGELNWELYRFAPYAIYIKRRNPKKKLIVLTRSARFDLYGAYADILVPLKIRYDTMLKANKFALDNYPMESYTLLVDYFYEKYHRIYDIKDHFYPELGQFRSLKWQFPREKMDYCFKPRNKNFELTDKFLDGNKKFIIYDNNDDTRIEDKNIIYMKDFIEWASDEVDKNSTFIGVSICLIKKCEAIIGNFSSSVSRLGVLFKKPLIALNEKRDDDAVGLLNPFKTPVIRCNDVEEGIEKYENNI